MYIAINDVIGSKTIDLSYSIRNFDFSKEIAVISMSSQNTQYEMTKPLKLKLVDGSEKEVLSKTYTRRELNAFVAGKHIISDLDNDPQIIKTNKLAKVTNMSLKWLNLIILITSKMGTPATPYLHIICLVPKILCISNPKHPNIRNSNMARLFP